MLQRLTAERRKSLVHWTLELVVVFAGVLIALWTQQWADARAAKERGVQAEIRIREELRNNTRAWLERAAIHACLKERLGRLAEGLSSGRNNWNEFTLPDRDEGLMTLRRIYSVPSRPWLSAAYEGALATGDLATISPDKQLRLAAAYAQVKESGELNASELQLATQLAPLQFSTPLTMAERNEKLAIVARLDWINGTLRRIAEQEFKNLRALGYRWNAQETAQMRENLSQMRRVYGECAPSGAIAASELRLMSGGA